jgi:predicted porin
MVKKFSGSNKSAVALACLLASWGAQAQSNVTIYGILDAGVTIVDDAGGSSRKLVDTGVMQGSRFGFRGSEDLGGGLRANFLLEQGILLDTGTLGQGGLAWGRQAWVGLSSDQFGSVLVGRQYDLMYDALISFHTPTVSAGGYANNVVDNDRLSGQRLNNSVKYRSPKMAGLTFSVMGAAPEGAANGAGKAGSAGVLYASGPLTLGAGYTYVRGATVDIRSLVTSATPVVMGGSFSRTLGAGGSYVLGQTTLHGLYSQAEFGGPTSGKFRNYEAGVAHRLGSWNLGLAYAHTKLSENKYDQLDLTADYFLSKRTDVYAQVIGQKASGAGARAAIFLLPGSSTDEQAAFRLGLRHAF